MAVWPNTCQMEEAGLCSHERTESLLVQTVDSCFGLNGHCQSTLILDSDPASTAPRTARLLSDTTHSTPPSLPPPIPHSRDSATHHGGYPVTLPPPLPPSLLPYLAAGTAPLAVGDALHGWLQAAEVVGQRADVTAEELPAVFADGAEVCVLPFRVLLYHLHIHLFVITARLAALVLEV